MILRVEENDVGGNAYARFSLSGENMSPEFWTTYFGVKPDVFVEKGKQFITPSGRKSIGVGRVSVWGYSSAGRVAGDDLNKHVDYLINTLNLLRAGLKEVADHQGASMRFFCYWDKASLKVDPMISDKIARSATEIGADIDIDVLGA